MMGLMMRSLLLLLACVAFAHAQPYPSKPARIVVGFTAGGPSDIVARIVAQQLTERMGQSFVVENRAGATGTIGAEIVAKSPPDGYSLYLASQTTHAVAPYMYAKVGYDPIKDFATVVRVAHNPLLMVVNPSFPVTSIKELIALARARPGQINFATGGIGSSPHMSMELFKSMTKIDMVPIHYKGDGAAIIDVIGGQVPMLTSSMSALMPYVKTGKMRGIAVTSMKRSTVAPEFPTIAESGLPGFEVITWFGILAPAATPKEIVNRLNSEIVASVSLPSVREQFTKMGFEIVANTPEQFAVFLKEENVKWGKVVKDLGLRAE
jgi:tripartite-type tricarboxylate transporter receptor subunit TctC